jgi:alkylated DNA nucleotide flippase Atl1
VVNKSGGLASGYPGGRQAHRKHLEEENVPFIDEDKVDLGKVLWNPDQDQ